MPSGTPGEHHHWAIGGERKARMLKALRDTLRPARSVTLSLLLVSTVYLLTSSLLDRRGFWIMDNAVKFIQLESAIRSHGRDLSIPWPGRVVDPDFAYSPLPPPFGIVRNGKLYATFPPAFALLSAIPYRLFGFAGLYVLPLVGGILSLLILARLGSDLKLPLWGRHLLILICGLCTPLWFYSVVFWEHTVAVCLFLGSVLYFLRFRETGRRSDLVRAFLLTALAVWFRDDFYVGGAALFLLLFQERSAAPGRRYPRMATAATAVAAMLAGLAPLWILQGIALGRPFGFHMANNATSLAAHLLSRGRVFYNLALAADPERTLSLLLGAPVVLAFLLAGVRPDRARSWRVPLLGLSAAAIGGVVLMRALRADDSIFHLFHSNGFYAAAPVLVLAALRQRETVRATRQGGAIRTILLLSALFAGLYISAAPEELCRGVHWGNRFFLPLYPLLAIAAVANIVAWFDGQTQFRIWAKTAVATAVALSLVLQLHAIDLLRRRTELSARLNQTLIDSKEKVVLTDVVWAPLELYAGFFDRLEFRIPPDEAPDQLVSRLSARGYRRALFITQAPEGSAPRGGLCVTATKLETFALTFVPFDLETAEESSTASPSSGGARPRGR